MTARRALARWGALGAGLVVWGLVTELGWVHHRALAGPIATLHSLVAGLANGTFLADAGASCARAGIAVVIGSLVGLPVGLALGHRTHFSRSVDAWLDFLRAIPPLLLLPVFLLALGYGEPSRVAAAAWGAGLVMSLHVAAGLRSEDPGRDRVLRALGATRWQRIRWVRAYELMPHALTGLRQATAMAVIVTVVTEMIMGAEHGLGARALAAQIAYDAPGLYVAVLSTGAIGLAASRFLAWLEARLVRWKQPEDVP